MGQGRVELGCLTGRQCQVAVADHESQASLQVRTAAVPSDTNLLGLLNHLTFAERSLFLEDNITDWQMDPGFAEGVMMSPMLSGSGPASMTVCRHGCSRRKAKDHSRSA
nr:hypothetical protein [Streptomyces coffeae]